MSGHILVTGGAGYIGSHICVQLLEAGYDVTILDDFSNTHPIAVTRIGDIAGKMPKLIEADLSKEETIAKAVAMLGAIDGAIHLAGLKAVGESIEQPTRYYDVNIGATLNLLKIMEQLSCYELVFSSSATVYGDKNNNPIKEEGASFGPTNPYGMTKHIIEQMLFDLSRADAKWRIASLRYFNPVGAHASGQIGEDPKDIPNNLFPFITQVAVGRREKLAIFGRDYDTQDGTGVRDYIHVVDLAAGHLAALRYLNTGLPRHVVVNLGTGQGVSVLEAVKVFEQATGQNVPYEIVARRSGDIAEVYADAGLAEKLLGWSAEYSFEQMCVDHWRWQSQNPNGYEG